MVETGGRVVKALIAGPRVELRESLAAMLMSMLPHGVFILEAEDAATAEQLLREHRPQLVIIDGDLPGEPWWRLVEAARALRTGARCSILVDTVHQHAVAMRAGADHASFKGEPPPRLFSQVEQLLGLS